MYDPQWREQAPCRNHPELGPDAWATLNMAVPEGDGAKAILVCRNVCPVSESCRQDIEGTWIIAGGGWWDHKGRFQEPPGDDLMDVHMVSAYTGVAPSTVRRWLMNKLLPAAKYVGGRAWFTVEDVKEVAKLHGPGCGTSTMFWLHHYRGEMPCERCRAAMAYALVA